VRLAVVSLLAVTTLWSGPAWAIETATFGSEPFPLTVGGSHRASFSVDLPAGGTHDDAVRIFNKSDQAIELEVYATDARRKGDSISPGSAPGGTEVGRWITFEDSIISLGPRASTVVPFTMRGPAEYPEGRKEFVGAILVEPVVRQGNEVAVVERLATAVYVTPKGGIAARIVKSPLTWVALALLLLVTVLHGQVAALVRRR
jgi:hypothetical protein